MTMAPTAVKAGRRGVTMLEIVAALLFLTAAIGAIYSVFSFSSRGTLDSYRETIAYTLALEGLEWYAGLGYDILRERKNNPNPDDDFNRNKDRSIAVGEITLKDSSFAGYPPDYQGFIRQIDLIDLGPRLMKIRVEVSPKSGMFIRRGSVVLEKIVGGEFGW